MFNNDFSEVDLLDRFLKTPE